LVAIGKKNDNELVLEGVPRVCMLFHVHFVIIVEVCDPLDNAFHGPVEFIPVFVIHRYSDC
jgi:hypothetical protein